MIMLPVLHAHDWSLGVDGARICIIDGLLRTILDLWFVVLPVTFLLYDSNYTDSCQALTNVLVKFGLK